MKQSLNLVTIAACLSLSLESARSQMDQATTREWLQQRKAQQTQASGKTKVFHDFTFSDEVEGSGIAFQHHAVEDANKLYKAVHYDHGTGLAVADVDGDGLLDIYFVSQLGGNELWRNLGNGRFENITAKAGVGLGDRVGVAASFADIDNDGDPDLFVTTVRGGNVLFENLGGGRFRDITKQAGLGYVGHSSGAVFFDFDNDGLLDLFLVNVGNYTTNQKGVGGYYIAKTDAFKGHLHPDRAEASILYRNLGHGVFKDVSESMHLVDKGWSGDASFTDLNGDGFPDLYVLNMQGDDHFYENQGGKSFVEKTATYFPKTSWGAMGIKFFDFNQDGRMDLFITDMHSDMTSLQSKASKVNARLDFETQKSEKMCTAEWTETFMQGSSNKIFGNSFYLNQDQSPWLEVSDKIGAETFWPWGFSAGDLNADGYEDVFITAGMGFGFRYAINSLLLNENGNRFAASEFVLGVEPRRNGRTQKTAFALECSGADKNNPLCQGKEGRVHIAESLSSRSSVMFDLDNDGDLDIVTNEMNDRPQVLISHLTERRKIHFLKIQLQGTKSNADGLGAVVKVFAGGKAWTQQHDGKSGYLGQSSMPLYFGLGEMAEATKLEINWPSGAKQIVTGPITANQLLKIKEPAK